MNPLATIPLRVLLPVLLLSCAAAAGLIAWKLSTRLITSEIEAQFLEESRLRITGIQLTLEHLFRRGDLSGVRGEVSGMATRPDVIAAFVVDEGNVIVASTRYATIGAAADAIGQELPEDLKSTEAARIAEVRASTQGRTVLSQARRVTVAYYPLLVTVDEHALRSERQGFFVLVSDLQTAKARALQAAGRQAIDFAALFGGLAVCAWGFVHFSLTRRVARLLTTTRHLAGGDLSARTGIIGSDELAQVAKGIDVMATRIAEDVTRRKRVEEELASRTEALANSLSLLNSTLNSTADGILATRFSGGVVCFNTPFRVMWGIPPDMLERGVDSELIAFIAPQVKDPEKFVARTDELFAHPEAESFDVIELQDGRVFERYTKPQWIEGKVVGMVVDFRDVTERRRAESELERAHQQLQEASRMAGMAEIATNVLHNVGNVLNSVNVSAALVVDSVKRSKLPGLGMALAMLREHESNLGAFFDGDPRGRQLLGYLGQLSEHLLAEQAVSVKELNTLSKNIDHIKTIVAMQQTYARSSYVDEAVNVDDLVEDSLRNMASLHRHGLAVVREFGDVPPVQLDKHKVLQILLNLLNNARQACDESGRADKRLTLRVGSGNGRVSVAVIDNGVGIAAENLTRIFNHGFTTRKGGHGFGLHSAALAAVQMGGLLRAHSDGVGQGATFTLELPLAGGAAR
jgi:signal transduction histidine kinase/HAMP domain-containing protein